MYLSFSQINPRKRICQPFTKGQWEEGSLLSKAGARRGSLSGMETVYAYFGIGTNPAARSEVSLAFTNNKVLSGTAE